MSTESITKTEPSQLEQFELNRIVLELPDHIKKMLKTNPHLFLGGGSLLSIISGTEVNDYDFFSDTDYHIEQAVFALETNPDIEVTHKFTTNNAVTIKLVDSKTKEKLKMVQFIKRWKFQDAQACMESFDFTVCQVVVWFDKGQDKLRSVIHDHFYYHLKAKKLVYTNPVRDEDSCGSLLRALRYAKKGYNVSKETICAVVARFVNDPSVGNSDFWAADEITKAEYLSEAIVSQFNISRGSY